MGPIETLYMLSVAESSVAEDLLNCNISRYLWIGWEGGQIQVGQGKTVGHNILVKAMIGGWQGVAGLSICTSGGKHGVWEFTQHDGKYFA